MREWFKPLQNNRGDYVQFAIALPVVLGLVFGGIIGYSVWNAKQIVGEAAWEAARVAASFHDSESARQKAAEIVAAHLPVSAERFDPSRDIHVDASSDPVRVLVQYHVPILFDVTRLLGGQSWDPVITVGTEAKVKREAPAW